MSFPGRLAIVRAKFCPLGDGPRTLDRLPQGGRVADDRHLQPPGLGVVLVLLAGAGGALVLAVLERGEQDAR
jgi:hypothetical protein